MSFHPAVSIAYFLVDPLVSKTCASNEWDEGIAISNMLSNLFWDILAGGWKPFGQEGDGPDGSQRSSKLVNQVIVLPTVRNEDLLPVHVFVSPRSDDTYEFLDIRESLKTSLLALSSGSHLFSMP